MNTDAKRYYEVLEVDPGASDETIRLAFRRRAKELHPDALSGDASAFILLKRAYDTLSSPVDRAAYDRLCEPAQPRFTRRTQPMAHQRPLPTPPPVRPKPSRRSGVGIGRYVIAFIVMAAISLGGVQAMISLTEAPPSIKTRAPAGIVSEPTASRPALAAPTESPAAPGSTKSGFWDAGSAPAHSK